MLTYENGAVKVVTPRFRLVEIDQTDGWCQELQEAAGRIYGVFLYDESEVTHCCDATPTHYLYPLYANTLLPVSEAVRDAIDEGFDTTEPFYVHARGFENLKVVEAKGPPQVWDNETYEELLEGYLEYNQANHQL